MSETTTAKRTNVSITEFFTAYVGSLDEDKGGDGTGIKGVAEKTGMTAASIQARASKLRNPEYETTAKLQGKDKVYRRAVDGENGETETTDKTLAKKNTQGQLVVIKVDKLGKDGKKVQKRPGFELPLMGHASTRTNFNDAAAMLAALLNPQTEGEGDSPEA